MWLIWDLIQIISALIVGTILLTAVWILLTDDRFRPKF
jgi:hypothetical protein